MATRRKKKSAKRHGHVPDAILKRRADLLGKTVGGKKLIGYVLKKYGK